MLNASRLAHLRKIRPIRAKSTQPAKIDNWAPVEIPFAIERNRLILLVLLMKELRVENLHVTIADKEIVRGLSLSVPCGQDRAIMGPNGSGKRTLAKALARQPD